jgi:hypothetical protein
MITNNMIMIMHCQLLVELFSNTIIFFVITAFKMVTNDEIEFGLGNKLVAGISSLIAEVPEVHL